MEGFCGCSTYRRNKEKKTKKQDPRSWDWAREKEMDKGKRTKRERREERVREKVQE